MRLDGYSVDTFGSAEQKQFKEGIGAYLYVSPKVVTIISVTDVTSTMRRRKLCASEGAVKVEFMVEVSTFEDTISISSKLLGETSSDDITVKLKAASLDLSTVVISTASVVTLAPPPPLPPDAPGREQFMPTASSAPSSKFKIQLGACMIIVLVLA